MQVFNFLFIFFPFKKTGAKSDSKVKLKET